MSTKLLGTPTWFYTMINVMRQRGAAKLEAYNVVGKIAKFVQENIPVALVEPATLSAIRSWQKLGVTVVGITSRPFHMADITRLQLSTVELDFASKFFGCVESHWPAQQGTFNNGVLYVSSGLKKGHIFAKF